MTTQIRFATVSDSREIGEVFATLPESIPVHCCDTWTINKGDTAFHGGLIFFRENNTDAVLGAFERSHVCRLWEPSPRNDKGCIFVSWDKDASEAKHKDNQDIVKTVIDDVTNVLLSGNSPTFTDKGDNTFISFRQGRGYTPALVGALNSHPLLKGCSFKFAFRRNDTKAAPANVSRESTEELISHGNFKAKPKKLQTRKRDN